MRSHILKIRNLRKNIFDRYLQFTFTPIFGILCTICCENIIITYHFWHKNVNMSQVGRAQKMNKKIYVELYVKLWSWKHFRQILGFLPNFHLTLGHMVYVKFILKVFIFNSYTKMRSALNVFGMKIFFFLT